MSDDKRKVMEWKQKAYRSNNAFLYNAIILYIQSNGDINTLFQYIEDLSEQYQQVSKELHHFKAVEDFIDDTQH